MQVIYKRTTTGAVQQWSQEIEGSKYRTISGQVGGKLVTSDWTQCEPKNVGKANERSAEDQVIAEVKANYKKKLDKDYHKNIHDIDNEKIFKAMLAQSYDKADKQLEIGFKEYYSQPKLDGMRCIATKNGMFTRAGKLIVGAPHIYQQLGRFFIAFPDLVIDGELYNHAYKDDFNTIMSNVRKTKPTKEDLDESERTIQYHMYDSVFRTKGNEGDLFAQRYEAVKQIEAQATSYHLVAVKTDRVTNQEELDILYAQYMEDGYEGQMIRANVPYEYKRTWSLVKRKEWSDSEFEFIRFEEGTGNWSGKAKAAWFKLDDGSDREFKATPKGTMQYCEELLTRENELKGSMCTVTYCPQRTPDGIPRFGRVKEFNREDN